MNTVSRILAFAAVSLTALACGGTPPSDGTGNEHGTDNAEGPSRQEGTTHPSSLVVGPPPPIAIDLRPNLVPTMTIPGTGYVYPPQSAYVTNTGMSTAPASQMRLDCYKYDGLGFYVGQCFSTITENIPPLASGQWYSPTLPWTYGGLLCNAAKCDVRMTVDSSNTVDESNENDNQIDIAK